MIAVSNIQDVAISPERSEEVEEDLSVVTCSAPTDMRAFMDRFTRAIAKHRFWAREKIGRVPA